MDRDRKGLRLPFSACGQPAPLSFFGLLGTVLLAPLPFGAVDRWAWATLTLAAGALLCLWAVEVMRGARVPRLGPFLPSAALLAGVLLWVLVQTWPGLPASLHHPVWATARSTLGIRVDGVISVDPAASLDGALRLVCYAAITFLALVHGRDAGKARAGIDAAAFAIALYAAYGLLVFLSGSENILWFAKTAYLGDLTGTMVNRNSFATLCGLGLLCCAARFLQDLSLSGSPKNTVWKERIRGRLDYLSGRGSLLLVAMALLLVALLLTHSRGGLASSILGLLALLGLHAAASRVSLRQVLVVSLMCTTILIAALAVSGEQTLNRIAGASAEGEERLETYRLSLEAIGDAPYAGTGLGTYREIFPLYRTPSIEKPYFRAHNTYLENAVELGLPAAGALGAAVGWLGFLCLRGTFRRRRHIELPALGFASTVLVGFHALVDFSLQIPAVAALYFLILGTACSQSCSARSG